MKGKRKISLTSISGVSGAELGRTIRPVYVKLGKPGLISRLLFLLITVSIVLFSCQKELSFEDNGVPVGSYYLKCIINGEERTFSYSATAVTYGYQAEDSVLTLMAFSSADADARESISLNIYYTSQTPGPATYSGAYTGDAYIIYGIYDADSTDITYTAGRTAQSISPLEIVLTTRTATEITGTFAGTFYSMNRTTGEMHPEYVTITDGEFNLRVQ